MFKKTKISQTNSKCFKIFQINSRYLKIFTNISKYLKELCLDPPIITLWMNIGKISSMMILKMMLAMIRMMMLDMMLVMIFHDI